MTFGRRPSPPDPTGLSGFEAELVLESGPPAPSPTAAAAPRPRYPWEPDYRFVAEAALRRLRATLLPRPGEDRSRSAVQAVMLMAGSLAGYAALNAALDRAHTWRTKGRMLGHRDLKLVCDHVTGDWINHILFEARGEPTPVATILRTALAMGAPLSQLPLPSTLSAQIERSIGTARFGELSGLDGLAPRGSCTALLQLWPRASATLGNAVADNKHLPQAYWPAMIGLVAGEYLETAGGALPAALGATLFVQAAMTCAKVDPRVIEPGKWTFTEFDGRLSVARLSS